MKTPDKSSSGLTTQMVSYFEKEYLTGTCLKSIAELEVDTTNPLTNYPRALTAAYLRGVLKGFTDCITKDL